jgi:phosphatidylglycerophosphate synthase
MLDGVMRRLIDPLTGLLGRRLAARGVQADHLTITGFVAGIACAGAIALRWDIAALVLLVMSRVLDGLDGAVARATRITDRGGFMDITCDFIFYGAVPLAFALRDPADNALAAAVLLAAFYANGASFLAFSAMAARRGMTSGKRGPKSLYFTTGLTEGTETILFFGAVILFPGHFPVLALLFALLCMITCLSRIILAWHVFGVDERPNMPASAWLEPPVAIATGEDPGTKMR